jgi:hypothetical protein
MTPDNTSSIERMLADPRSIEKALQKAVQEALLQHKAAGNPVAVWRDGRVTWVPAEEIEVSLKSRFLPPETLEPGK